MLQNPWKHRSWKGSISRLAVIALLLPAGAAYAAAPQAVGDVQIELQTGLNRPQSIVLAPNNSYYVADTNNNQVLAYVKGAQSKVNTGAFTLVNPQALAVDTAGDLFIGDSPTAGTGRVIEATATNGVLNGTVNLVVMGGALKDVTALTVDTTPISTTYNTLYIGDDLSNAIYTVAAGSTTLVNSGITGLPSNVVPSALIKDAAGNLYVADVLSTLYQVPAGSTTASTYVIPGFLVYSPTGLAFDPKGDLYVLTFTSMEATPSQATAQNIIEVPGGDVTSAYRVPFTGSPNASGIGIDTSGNLYLLGFATNDVTELIYSSAVGLGQTAVNSYGLPVNFNYEINTPLQNGGFLVVSQGDQSSEVVNYSNTCQDLHFTDGSNGGPITPSNPYLCEAQWVAQPAFPGLRYGAVQFLTTGARALVSTPVFFTGLAGASVVYPLTAAAGAGGIKGPVAVAVSGLNRKIYISDGSTPAIYSASGPNGTRLTQISTAPVTLQLPQGIAINGEGDLYIVDFDLAEVVVVPALPSQTPYAFNPGNLLQHPLSLAFDTDGNLFVGDAGPGGNLTDSDNPGYIVEIPAGGGAPFKVNTGALKVIFPLAVATDPYTGDIYVGDGGPISEVGAQVVHIVADGGPATVVNLPGITQPVGIVFDPAEQYYVLDQNAKTITVVPPSGTPFLLPFDNSLFTFPAALAATAGGQNFLEVNLGQTSGPGTPGIPGNLVYLNGTTSTLAFGSVRVGQQSATMTATVNNIGSTALTLGAPYFTSNMRTSPFNVLGSTTCANSLELAPANTCGVNVQFRPTSRGTASERLTFRTNGYVTNDSVLNFSGTGTGNGGFTSVNNRSVSLAVRHVSRQVSRQTRP